MVGISIPTDLAACQTEVPAGTSIERLSMVSFIILVKLSSLAPYIPQTGDFGLEKFIAQII
jgi:hypothetical protein